MSLNDLTVEGMKKPYSPEHKIAKEAGFEPHPVVRFGEYDYVILFSELIHPGHNTAEVINVTEFNGRSEKFEILVSVASKKYSEGDAWIYFGEEGGMLVLAEYTPKNTVTDVKVPSAVLSYRIEPATTEDVRAVRQMLDEEIDARIFQELVEFALRSEEKLQAEMPGFIRQLRKERSWSQAELGRRLGISQQYVAQLEAGSRPVTTELQQKLAALLQESPAAHKVEELIANGIDPREIQRELAQRVRETAGKMPRGQLYQPCDDPDCSTEPVCLNCLMCEAHCTCNFEQTD